MCEVLLQLLAISFVLAVVAVVVCLVTTLGMNPLGDRLVTTLVITCANLLLVALKAMKTAKLKFRLAC